jgi:predicted metalloprotease with PDZ domain
VRAAADAVAGRSTARFFDRCIDGVDELPVPGMLRKAGLEVGRRPPWVEEEDRVRARRQRGWSGLTFANSGGERATVRNVVPGSPAWRAGLTYGDEPIAVDDQRVTAGTVARRLADRQPGQSVRVSYFRQDLLRTARWIVVANPERSWDLAIDGSAGSHARAVRRGWLGV